MPARTRSRRPAPAFCAAKGLATADSAKKATMASASTREPMLKPATATAPCAASMAVKSVVATGMMALVAAAGSPTRKIRRAEAAKPSPGAADSGPSTPRRRSCRTDRASMPHQDSAAATANPGTPSPGRMPGTPKASGQSSRKATTPAPASAAPWNRVSPAARMRLSATTPTTNGTAPGNQARR